QRPDDEVALAVRDLTGTLAHDVDTHLRAAERPHLDDVVEPEREAHRVEPRTEVGARRGHAHTHVVVTEPHAQPSPRAVATETTSALTRSGTTSSPDGVRRAHCGSFRPWPVTVTVMRAPAGTRPS